MATSLLIHLHYIALIQIIAAYFYNTCAYDYVSVGHDKWQNVNKENLQENITHTARSLHISYSLSHTFLVVICTDLYTSMNTLMLTELNTQLMLYIEGFRPEWCISTIYHA